MFSDASLLAGEWNKRCEWFNAMELMPEFHFHGAAASIQPPFVSGLRVNWGGDPMRALGKQAGSISAR